MKRQPNYKKLKVLARLRTSGTGHANPHKQEDNVRNPSLLRMRIKGKGIRPRTMKDIKSTEKRKKEKYENDGKRIPFTSSRGITQRGKSTKAKCVKSWRRVGKNVGNVC